MSVINLSAVGLPTTLGPVTCLHVVCFTKQRSTIQFHETKQNQVTPGPLGHTLTGKLFICGKKYISQTVRHMLNNNN